jgi:hypothetical protein
VEGGQIGKRIAEGMLAIALDKLGYEDAVRMRVGQEMPIFTHTRTTRVCTSSYLDRILVRGAKVTRAGILAPGRFKGLIECDHALVIADIEVRVQRKANPLGEAQRPLAKASIEFIQLGRKRKKENGISLVDSIEHQMTLEGDEGGKLEGVNRAIPVIRTIITELEQSRDPDNESDRESQLLTVHKVLSKLMRQVYEPVVRWAVQSKFLAKSAGPNTKDRSMNSERYGASKQLQGAFDLKLGTSKRQRDEGLTSLSEAASRLHDSWVRYREVMKPGWPNIMLGCEDEDWPDIPENLRLDLQLLRVVGGTRREEIIKGVKILEGCKVEMVRTKWLIRESVKKLHISESSDAARRDFECGNISGVFQRIFPKKNTGPNATTPDQYVNGGIIKSAVTAAEARRAEEQKWEKLYCVNKFNRPPFLKFTEKMTEDGLPSADFVEIPFEERERYSSGILRTHDAVKTCKSSCVEWDLVVKRITDGEHETMERSRANKRPGKSGFKHATLQFFPSRIRQLFRDIIQIMWLRQLLTEELVDVLLKLLPKPNGDMRGISLIEEITKNLEWILAKRIVACIKKPYKLEDVFSGLNRAYSKGRSTTDVLYAHAMVLQNAVMTGNPLVVCMWDLAKCYDTIQVDVVDMLLGQMNAPRKVRRFLRALFQNSKLTLSTGYQDSRALVRKIGIHQGSSLSCILLLIALEPMHRTQVGLMREFMYRISMSPGALINERNLQPKEFEDEIQEGTSSRIPMVLRMEEGGMCVIVRSLGFCDDHNMYTRSVQGMEACMNVLAEVMAGLGIGFDEKVMLLVFNIDEAHTI